MAFAATAPRCFPTEFTFSTGETTVSGGLGRSAPVPLRMGHITFGLEDPGPIKLTLYPERYTTSTEDVLQ